MPKPVLRVAYYLLCALMSPLILIGYIVWVGRAIVTGRSGVSGTAQGPLLARFSEHKVGTRRDEAAERLLRALPDVPSLGLLLAVGPLLLAHRLTGYLPRAVRYPFEGDISPPYEASARICFFDAAVDRHLRDSAQFVILGAGFDTRAYRLPNDRRVRVFEVDSPQTQLVKRAALKKAGIDSRGVTFVPADFEAQDWLACLTGAGFDPARRTLFLWEGVTMYLNREAVEDTLRKIASTAPGSVVTFDYFTTEALESRSLYWRYGRAATKAAGEKLKFGVDSTPPSRQRLAELLRSCGLSLSEQRTLGADTQTRRAWGGFATATVPTSA
ncbi:Putative S-adenosyl-L-methionine-dependent methyltransferase [Mycobacterium basiliense]|uniref:S-adenosyl-L-methionine-dependent methyltransferase n=1 Tax=Mycobacterium basiliense TaxID=2094119 RepID=A0A3S5CZU9_9MYCO|nr:SAM-dependent methyltransferase [Mycobacterium basiliense]VDM89236.1 Putative S-adenosyl-L-methionine-dependent methyltransferase [Mycobacterium basiliense]